MARQIIVEIIGDEKKFSKSLDAATGKAKGFGNIVTGIGQGIGQGIVGLVGSATSAVSDFVSGSIEDFSALQQGVGAAESVYGEASAGMIEWAKRQARESGQSTAQVLANSASMGAAFQNAGYSAEESAEMFQTLNGRGADLAAMFGGTVTDATSAMGAAFRGEFDSLEQYGIAIKQSDVNARLAAEGLDHLTGTERKQAEQGAIMNMIMEQSAQASGQFAEESGSLAGQQAIAAAEMENTSAMLGEKLAPIMTAVMKFIIDKGIPALMGLVDWLQKTWKEIEPVVKAVAKELLPVFQNVWAFLSGTLIPILMNIAQAVFPALWNVLKTLGGIFSTVWGAISGYVRTAVSNISGFINTAKSVFTAVSTTMNTVRDRIKGAWNTLIGFFGGLPGKIGRAVSGIWDGITRGFKNVINTVIRWWNNLGFTVPSIDLGPLGKFGGFHIGTPNIAYLHQGGIVPGVPGSDVPAILQAGERVLPMNQANRGGTIAIHFHGPVFAEDQFIDDFTRKIAMRLRTVGG